MKVQDAIEKLAKGEIQIKRDNDYDYYPILKEIVLKAFPDDYYLKKYGFGNYKRVFYYYRNKYNPYELYVSEGRLWDSSVKIVNISEIEK